MKLVGILAISFVIILGVNILFLLMRIFKRKWRKNLLDDFILTFIPLAVIVGLSVSALKSVGDYIFYLAAIGFIAQTIIFVNIFSKVFADSNNLFFRGLNKLVGWVSQKWWNNSERFAKFYLLAFVGIIVFALASMVGHAVDSYKSSFVSNSAESNAPLITQGKGYRKEGKSVLDPRDYQGTTIEALNYRFVDLIDKKVSVTADTGKIFLEDKYGNLTIWIYDNKENAIDCFWYNDKNADTFKLESDFRAAVKNKSQIVVYGEFKENPKSVGNYNILIDDILFYNTTN